MRRFLTVGFSAAVLLCSAHAAGETISIVSASDNTLYESSAIGALSNGVGDYLFAGRTNINTLRRGLLKFDFAELIPAGAKINSAALTLHVSLSPRNVFSPSDFGLHRVQTDWGEGDSNAFSPGGLGTGAANGDATWHHTFFSNQFWTNPGGDFDASASATASVGDPGFYTWNTTANLVSDVQGWVNGPATNFGWLIAGNENANKTARRFDTRENSEEIGDVSVRPLLQVDFTPPKVGDNNFDGIVDAADLAIVLADWETFGVEGLIDLFDETPVPGAPLFGAVPEPSTFLLALLGLLGASLRRRRFAG